MTETKDIITIANAPALLEGCSHTCMQAIRRRSLSENGQSSTNTKEHRVDHVANEDVAVAALQGEDPMMLDGELKQQLRLSLLPTFRLLFAQIAASCASAAKAILADVGKKRVRAKISAQDQRFQEVRRGSDILRRDVAGTWQARSNRQRRCMLLQGEHKLLFEPSWAVIEFELAGALYTGLKSFWATLKAKPRDFIDPSPEASSFPSEERLLSSSEALMFATDE